MRAICMFFKQRERVTRHVISSQVKEIVSSNFFFFFLALTEHYHDQRID